MTEAKDRIRADRTALEQALREAGAVFKGRAICCPFHDDKHPSSSVYQGEDGAWRFKCQTASCGFCGDVFDVRQRTTGQTVEDQLRELQEDDRPKKKPARVFGTVDELKASVNGLEAAYVYTDPDTRRPDMIVLRYRDGDGRKHFIQARPEAGGGYAMQAPPKPWPIYNRTNVRNAKAVIVVEGEKCVHELDKCGSVATTAPGGAGKADLADWKPLAGKKCYLWPDADEADPKTGKRSGIEHMRRVAERLAELDPAPEVYWIDPDALGLPPKGDCVDYLDLSGETTPERKRWAIQQVLTLAQPLSACKDLEELIEDTIAGRRKIIPWPWPGLGHRTRALMPGTVSLICGDPGSTKSFLVLEAATYWIDICKTAVFELEEDRAYHLNRALAQLSNNSSVLDSDWIEANPDEARKLYAFHAHKLGKLAKAISAAPDKQVTLGELAAWVEEKCKAGCRIIAIDPVTAAEVDDKPWSADSAFLMKVKTLARQYGASIVLVTHPKKGNKNAGLDDLAGGAAYPRFSQTVIWIKVLESPEELRVQPFRYPPTNALVNRKINIVKARNGPGGQRAIGYYFDGKSMRFAEQGLILKDGEGGDF